MFEFGEGRTTRSSIRSLKDEAAVKYITRATLQRASGSEERKSGVLAKHNCANSKMNDQTKASRSRTGVYILPFISILVFIKKLPFSADFIKNWVHFIKNSDFLLKNDQI